jgi:hypothetical protein
MGILTPNTIIYPFPDFHRTQPQLCHTRQSVLLDLRGVVDYL